MKKSEFIEILAEDIHRYAYRARVAQRVQSLGFDEDSMEYHWSIARGRCFEAIRLFNLLTGSTDGDDLFGDAERDALEDIRAVGDDIVSLLNLAGFDGPSYFSIHVKFNS